LAAIGGAFVTNYIIEPARMEEKEEAIFQVKSKMATLMSTHIYSIRARILHIDVVNLSDLRGIISFLNERLEDFDTLHKRQLFT
jgi:hypothetical protein